MLSPGVGDIDQRDARRPSGAEGDAPDPGLEALDRLGRLASSVVHELGNQLTGIVGPAQVLADGLAGADQELAAQVVRSSESVQEVLRRLSVLGRLRLDRPRGMASDACPTVQEAAQALRWVLPPATTVEARVPGHRRVVGLSPAELTQLLTRLVLALAAGDEGEPRLVLEVGEGAPGAPVQVSVARPGGVLRLGAEAARAIEGHLGLPSGAVSSEPGYVQVSLPAGGQDATEVGRRGVALVVDPEPGVQLVLGAALRRLGYEVFAVEDAVTARQLAEARGEPFAVVVAELRLPDGDGLALAQAVSATRRVVMSADPSDPELQADLQSSGVALLGKPFQMEEVAALFQRSITPGG